MLGSALEHRRAVGLRRWESRGDMNGASESFPLEIDVETLQRVRESGESFLLIDCREPDEHALVRIEGSKLIPMRETPGRLAEIEPHRGERIVVHCHHGGRSLRVTQFLRQQGFETAQNLAGGIDAWAEQIDPSLPRY